MFTHNPKKKNHCYHIATPNGTLCKMENSHYYQYQLEVPNPPVGKKLCIICNKISKSIGISVAQLTHTDLLETIYKLHIGITVTGCWSSSNQSCLDAAIESNKGNKWLI